MHMVRVHGRDAELHERFLRAQLIEGEVLDDADTLVRLSAKVDVPEDGARRVLEGDDYTADVDEDIRGLRALGGNGGRSPSSTADTASRERSQPRCSCAPSRQLARTRPNG